MTARVGFDEFTDVGGATTARRTAARRIAIESGVPSTPVLVRSPAIDSHSHSQFIVDAASGPALDESSLAVATGAVACSVLLGVFVLAFALLAEAATPGWTLDTHREGDRNAIHHLV